MKQYQEKIFNSLKEQYPNPQTELQYPNNFCLLISIVLSAQSTDIMVNKATNELFKIADSPEKMLNLGLEKIKSHIKILGLYNNKANNIIKLSKILIDDFEGKIPQEFEILQKLPGVGRKTAGVYLNCAFLMPIIAVDTHVFRVANRLELVKINHKKNLANKFFETEKQLNNKILPHFKQNAHHLMILHGRYCCKARKPKCQNCIVKEICPYDKKNLLE